MNQQLARGSVAQRDINVTADPTAAAAAVWLYAGNAGQPKHGGLPGYSPENAVRGTGVWGGRPDAEGEIWLGAAYATDTVVDCAALSQVSNSEHVTCTSERERERESRRRHRTPFKERRLSPGFRSLGRRSAAH